MLCAVFLRSQYLIPYFPSSSLSFGMGFAPDPWNIGVFSDFMPFRQGNPMGDCQNGDLRVNFDRTLKLKFWEANSPPTLGCWHIGNLMRRCI